MHQGGQGRAFHRPDRGRAGGADVDEVAHFLEGEQGVEFALDQQDRPPAGIARSPGPGRAGPTPSPRPKGLSPCPRGAGRRRRGEPADLQSRPAMRDVLHGVVIHGQRATRDGTGGQPRQRDPPGEVQPLRSSVRSRRIGNGPDRTSDAMNPSRNRRIVGSSSPRARSQSRAARPRGPRAGPPPRRPRGRPAVAIPGRGRPGKLGNRGRRRRRWRHGLRDWRGLVPDPVGASPTQPSCRAASTTENPVALHEPFEFVAVLAASVAVEMIVDRRGSSPSARHGTGTGTCCCGRAGPARGRRCPGGRRHGP